MILFIIIGVIEVLLIILVKRFLWYILVGKEIVKKILLQSLVRLWIFCMVLFLGDVF
jgi:hypothetical protein